MGLAKLRDLAGVLAPRANALAVLAGLVVLVAAAWTWEPLAGIVALGLSLIVVGMEVPRQ